MGFLDYIIIGIIAVWFVLSVIFIFKRKKKGGCAGCGECSSRNDIFNHKKCNGKCDSCNGCK